MSLDSYLDNAKSDMESELKYPIKDKYHRLMNIRKIILYYEQRVSEQYRKEVQEHLSKVGGEQWDNLINLLPKSE